MGLVELAYSRMESPSAVQVVLRYSKQCFGQVSHGEVNEVTQRGRKVKQSSFSKTELGHRSVGQRKLLLHHLGLVGSASALYQT